MWYFLKRGLFKDIKNDIPSWQTRKYKKYKYKIYKYTNTAYDEVPERKHMRFLYSTSSFISGVFGHCYWSISVEFLFTVVGNVNKIQKMNQPMSQNKEKLDE